MYRQAHDMTKRYQTLYGDCADVLSAFERVARYDAERAVNNNLRQ